ncbi:MAG TPA: NlpC/P60 family protein [Micromonosporaceae bacterium]
MVRPRPRPVVRVLVTLAVATLVAATPAGHAYADPTSADVEKQIDAAWEKLEPVIEQFNRVRSELASNQKRSAALAKRIEPLRRTVQDTEDRVSALAATYYRGGGSVAALNALLSSGSPTELGDRLHLLDRLARSERQQIGTLSAQRARYAAEKKTLDTLIATEKRQQADLAKRKTQIDAEIKRLQALHDRLVAAEAAARAAAARAEAAARAAAAARANTTTPTTSTSSLYIGGKCPAVPTTGPAAIAAKTACAQIGDPYVWGAAGPDSFDCSGLTQYAWKAAGVTLTHYTGAQWNEGTPVARSDLRTGDLVFFYSDVHHVGMYVGNGLIVHASRTGVPVKMADMQNMAYTGARRPG